MLSAPPTSQVHCATCPLPSCRGLVLYLRGDVSAECYTCKAKHQVSSLVGSAEVSDLSLALALFWRLLASKPSKPLGSPVTKVLGLSPYYCKLLSPLLTCYGIDKAGKAVPIQELKNCDTFDCSWLGSRSFSIEPEHLDVPGYGRDESGSANYLSGTLSLLQSFNNGRDVLVPLHTDGDGHCLVHAVSRAIIGRELFWHPLRTGLKHHLLENLPRYKELFSDFINSSEWDDIIAECDPEYAPKDNELHGLRNIHIFGLSNVLKRPILLLDSVAGMQSSGDYSALFLPKLVPPEDCRDASGTLHKPICLAWSSPGRNHYIPLVGIRGREAPLFPRSLLPKAWGVSQSLAQDYLEFTHNDCLVIGGKAFPDSYLLKLTSGINALFRQMHGVDPGLVADVYYSNFKKTAVFGLQLKEVLTATKTFLQERRLYHCLSCGSVNILPLSTDWLRPHGLLYNLAKKQTKGGILEDQHIYNFHSYGVSCIYNARKDVLVVEKSTQSLEFCVWCNDSKLRLIHVDGSLVYENGDRTTTPVDSIKTRCKCGFKHWYNGREYDNPPLSVPISFEWKSRVISDEVLWFEGESDPSLNSNANQVAAVIIHKYFPGEVHANLNTIVVAKILEKVKVNQNDDHKPSEKSLCGTPKTSATSPGCDPVRTSQTITGQNLSISTPVPGATPKIQSNDFPPTISAKKRPSNIHGGGVRKHRSLPASLAAAAAISRAEANSSGVSKSVARDVCTNMSRNILTGESPVQMTRLGPGYSVIATSQRIPNSEESDKQALIQKYPGASELLQNILGLLSGPLPLQNEKPQSDPPIRTFASRQTESSYGNLSGLAELLNVGGTASSSDYMEWDEEEDSLQH